MNTVLEIPQPAGEIGLDDVIEPLADLICAADRPAAALKRALSTLYRQVELTNELASTRIAHFSGRRLSEGRTGCGKF